MKNRFSITGVQNKFAQDKKIMIALLSGRINVNFV